MIFFDLDGTLLDSNGLWIRIDETFLALRGISSVPQDYIEYVTNHVAPKAAAYTKERFQLEESAEEILKEWQSMATKAYCNELPLKKGALELLESLKQEDVPMCLLTACIPELCYGALENHGISSYFKTVHTAIELGMDKRDKELFPLVANLQGKHPSECILIDDAIDYCSAAKAAGFTVYGIHDSNTSQTKAPLKDVCDDFVEDLTKLSAKMLKDKCKSLEEAYRGTL
ncbi:MAG: HAD family phosphatase [Eubacteriales bacterium]